MKTEDLKEYLEKSGCFNMDIPIGNFYGEKLDKGMVSILRTVNSSNWIWSFSSCEGHIPPELGKENKIPRTFLGLAFEKKYLKHALDLSFRIIADYLKNENNPYIDWTIEPNHIKSMSFSWARFYVVANIHNLEQKKYALEVLKKLSRELSENIPSLKIDLDCPQKAPRIQTLFEGNTECDEVDWY